MKQEKNIWEQSRVELFQKLDCRETGLSQEDAALRLLKYGANELHAGKQKSVWQIFLGQFADFLVLILILAAVISAPGTLQLWPSSAAARPLARGSSYSSSPIF